MPESLALKRQVVAELDELAAGDSIIASNSSSYTISEIMEGQTFKNPKQMVSLHSCEYSFGHLHEWILLMGA